MKFHTIEQERLAQDSKLILLKSMHEREVTQDVLAFECGVDRSTISRWCNPQSDQFPNLYLITNCANSQSENVQQVAMDMLQWLAGISGCEINARRLKIITDGSLEDELQDLAIAQGKFGQALKENKIEPAEKIARTVQEIASRMMAEVAEFRKRTREAKP